MIADLASPEAPIFRVLALTDGAMPSGVDAALEKMLAKNAGKIEERSLIEFEKTGEKIRRATNPDIPISVSERLMTDFGIPKSVSMVGGTDVEGYQQIESDSSLVSEREKQKTNQTIPPKMSSFGFLSQPYKHLYKPTEARSAFLLTKQTESGFPALLGFRQIADGPDMEFARSERLSQEATLRNHLRSQAWLKRPNIDLRTGV